MRNSGLLQRQKRAVDAWRTAERETWIQYLADTMMVVLNDPAVMGRAFGKKRIMRVFQAWGDVQREYLEALNDGAESDYVQAKLDERLKLILGGEGFEPFGERYPWVKQQKI